MKIKQTTRIVVLAIALVAVIGVGAVSFAAWTGTANSIANASASVGSVRLVGFTAENPTMALEGKLIPNDQPTGAITDGVKAITGTLPEYEVSGNYTINVAVELKSGTFDENSALIVTINDQAKNIVAGDNATWELTQDDAYTTITDMGITLELASSVKTDMNAVLDITITLASAPIA